MNHLNIWERIQVTFFNSSFWFNFYIKHTREYKKEIKDMQDRIYKIRKEAIGK